MSVVTTNRIGVNEINRILDRDSLSGRPPSRQPIGESPTISEDSIEQVLHELLDVRFSNRQQVILKRFNRSFEKLSAMRSATEQLFRLSIDQGFDFSALASLRNHPATLGAMRDLLGEFYDFRFTVPPSVKSLELLIEPPSVIYERLAAHLDASVRLFVRELFALMGRMMKQRVLGQIRYAGEQWENCEFSFFRSKPVRKSRQCDVKVSPEQVRNVYRRHGKWWKKKFWAIQYLETGVATIRHVRIKHLLSNAQTVPLDSWRLPLPERIRPVAAAIPSFLRPWASVVHGTLEYALMVEADVADAPYSYSRTYEHVEEERHYDPCLLLGPAVLIGWCPDEQPHAGLSRRLAAGAWHQLVAREGGGE